MRIIKALKHHSEKRETSMEYFGERGYMDMMRDVLDHGVEIPDRTGVGTIALFDSKVIFNVGEVFPFSTSRIAGLRPAFKEWSMFMTGETQTKTLEAQGVNFWVGNTTREFLDKRGLKHLPEGCMGKAYGFQFRNAGGDMKVVGSGDVDSRDIVTSGGVDQLRSLYEGLKNDPYGRRHYVTFWNPNQNDEMALTPCWHSHQFVVLPDENGDKVLHLKLLNRSLDSLFGFLFAVQQYALYQVAMAKLLGFKVGRLSCDLTQYHLYMNQIEYAREAVDRELGTPGTVTITKELNTLEDLISLKWEDIRVDGLEVNNKPFVAEKPPMAA